MFKKAGKKLAQGAMEEIQENQQSILNPDTILSIAELAIGLLSLAWMTFGGLKSSKAATQPMIVVINNIPKQGG